MYPPIYRYHDNQFDDHLVDISRVWSSVRPHKAVGQHIGGSKNSTSIDIDWEDIVAILKSDIATHK